MDEYRGGPVADLRRFVTAGNSAEPGAASDVGKIADAIIGSTAGPAPLRLVLGTDAYQAIHGALSDRLAELTAQRTTAASTDNHTP